MYMMGRDNPFSAVERYVVHVISACTHTQTMHAVNVTLLTICTSMFTLLSMFRCFLWTIHDSFYMNVHSAEEQESIHR